MKGEGMKKDTPKTMESLVEKAIGTLHEFFDNKADRTSTDVATARIASSVLSTVARERQSAGAADALSFMMARELSSDKGQLEHFLSVAMPNAAIVKALPPAKES